MLLLCEYLRQKRSVVAQLAVPTNQIEIVPVWKWFLAPVVSSGWRWSFASIWLHSAIRSFSDCCLLASRFMIAATFIFYALALKLVFVFFKTNIWKFLLY